MNPLLIYQGLAVVFGVVVVYGLGYYAGYRRNSRRYRHRAAADRDEMLTIERSLKRFWDHERAQLEEEKDQLEQRITFLEERLEYYRRKAAGIGMMGLRKNKLSDMLITLLIENETLEEKLFLQNLKLKEERDEYLKNELRQISYKRILLSELINQAEVRREMERLIKDKNRWKRLQIKAEDLEPLDLSTGRHEGDDAPAQAPPGDEPANGES